MVVVMSNVKTVKVSVRLPEPLLREIDALVESGLYSNRSEVMKEALREFIRSQKRKMSRDDFIDLMLRAIEPLLAEDWNSEEDSYWDLKARQGDSGRESF